MFHNSLNWAASPVNICILKLIGQRGDLKELEFQQCDRQVGVIPGKTLHLVSALKDWGLSSTERG